MPLSIILIIRAFYHLNAGNADRLANPWYEVPEPHSWTLPSVTG